MGIFNAFIAYKFIKILSMPWKETDAFKFGIIDKKGKVLKKMKDLRTSEERKSYTIFHRLIWNLKKLLEKLPIFKSRLASFAAALYLIKEQVDPEGTLIEDMFLDYLKENGCDVDSMMLNESFEMRDGTIKRGLYIIEGKNIFIEENVKAFDEIIGIPLFKIDFLGEEKIITKEEAIANVAGGGENIAGLDGKPPVPKKPKVQRRAGVTGGIAEANKKEYIELDEAWTADSVIKNAEIGSKKGYGINIKRGGGVTKTPFKHMLLTMQKHKNVRVTFDHGKDVFEGTPQSVAIHINQTLGIKESVEVDEGINKHQWFLSPKYKKGDTIKWKGKKGTIVRYDDRGPQTPFYVVSFKGQYKSENIPRHKLEESVEHLDEIVKGVSFAQYNSDKKKDNTAAVAKQVKQAVKKYTKGKVTVRSKGGKTRFIMVMADNIDNKLRKMMLDVAYPKANIKDKSNIFYGNISDKIISAKVDHWVKALGLKESVEHLDEVQTEFKVGDKVKYKGKVGTITKVGSGGIQWPGLVIYLKMKNGKKVSTMAKDLIKENIQTGPPATSKDETPASFAGARIFKVSSEEYCNCLQGRKKHERWKRKLNMDNIDNQSIRSYAHKNPGKSIIVQNDTTGEMSYLLR